MRKALFVCYGGGHADALIPVMKYLIKNTDLKVEAIGVNLAADKIRNSGIPAKSLSYYLDIRSVEIGFPLARERHNFSSAMSFADSIAYYGYTMSDLIDEVGEEAAYQILDIFDRRTMFPVKTMMRILSKEKPDVVITTTMNRFEAATLYAAGKLGIPSVKVEDLIGRINKTFPDKIQVETESERRILIDKGVKKDNIILKSELKNPIVMSYYEEIHKRQLETKPTAFCVFCDYAKHEIEKRGIDPKTIHVTGQPAFDEHPWFVKNTNREEICRLIGLDKNKLVVTFMSQPNSEREDVFRTLVKAVKILNNDNIQIVIKLHPNEDGTIQRIILEEEKVDSFKIIKDLDARKLIAISDLIITVSSTTGLEAAVMGKPLVYLNVTDKQDYIPYADMGIGVRCTDATQTANAMRMILIDKTTDCLLNVDDYRTDGEAAKRVGEIIVKLANKDYKPSKKVGIIIQARMGSTRLPGKVMKNICGSPQVKHVVDSVKKSKFASSIIVATSDDPNNEPLKEYLTSENILWYEGDEDDVLGRFIGAAEKYDIDIIVRVTADNPLTNAECIDRSIESHIQTGADYTMMKGLPIGVAGEIVNVDALKEAYSASDVTARDKEHVTIYLYEHKDRFRINYIKAPNDLYYPELYLTVDTKDDFDNMTDIFNHLYHDGQIDLKDVINYMNK